MGFNAFAVTSYADCFGLVLGFSRISRFSDQEPPCPCPRPCPTLTLRPVSRTVREEGRPVARRNGGGGGEEAGDRARKGVWLPHMRQDGEAAAGSATLAKPGLRMITCLGVFVAATAHVLLDFRHPRQVCPARTVAGLRRAWAGWRAPGRAGASPSSNKASVEARRLRCVFRRRLGTPGSGKRCKRLRRGTKE